VSTVSTTRRRVPFQWGLLSVRVVYVGIDLLRGARRQQRGRDRLGGKYHVGTLWKARVVSITCSPLRPEEEYDEGRYEAKGEDSSDYPTHNCRNVVNRATIAITVKSGGRSGPNGRNGDTVATNTAKRRGRGRGGRR